ncbi:T9SS type B sorting domain-containing protein [Flavobacterium sp. RHBU_24]|uniref:T9SS type B sorting domain-containing protein n=1 Tax=Flavobacterium sp. RHBU_24 TaxID=3391185 RepID=UPI0039851434
MKTIITFLFLTICVQAQEYNIWYFGGNAGLDFNGGAPVALTDGELYSPEGSASIANTDGELMFYTNGERVWNKNHETMVNGHDLTGHRSSVQSSLIIPKPQSQNIYFIFTTDQNNGANGLRYSVVNMEDDGGLGAVTEKNTLLNTPITEALTATWHSNGEDIWVVAHNYGTSLFTVYLVTANGVASSPVISDVGFITDQAGQACLKISANGSKLALSRFRMQNGTELFDFNASTGVVSNPVTVTTTSDYNVEFSASGDVLYISTAIDLFTRKIYQYNLQANNIAASGIEIYTHTLSAMGLSVGALQRGPDDKIYVAINSRRFLSVIHQPDVIGLGCDFEEDGISLGGVPGVFSTVGLPNTILSPLRIGHENTVCIGEQSLFSIGSPGLFSNIHWDFGDGSTSQETTPLHTYQQAGSFEVRLTAEQNGVTRSSRVIIHIAPPPSIIQPNDMRMCDEGTGNSTFILTAQNTLILGNQNPDNFLITYHHSLEHVSLATNNLPENYTNISNPQTVYARIEDINSGCYAITSFGLFVEPKPQIMVPESYRTCRDNSIIISAPEGFESYLWSTGETSRDITVNQPGNYTLTVTRDYNGRLCENSKTVTVYISDTPIIKEVYSTDWTDSLNVINISVSGSGDYEYSLDGFIYQDSPQFSGLGSGMYTVFVRDKNGCGSATEEVVLMMFPKFFTPNGDGINDMWRIKYSWNEPALTVHIFDRYGKHITSFFGNSPGWDGKFNGNAMPATDYWFTVEREDGRKYRGHFSMIR